MDAITILKDDHKAVKRLLREFGRLEEDDTRSQRHFVDRIIEELSVHSALEEQLFYPFVRETVTEAADLVTEGLEEHHVMKWTLLELEDMPPGRERFDAKVDVLRDSLLHHIAQEEEELFPKVRQAGGRKRLRELGEAMQKARDIAPTRPPPRGPDEPPPIA